MIATNIHFCKKIGRFVSTCTPKRIALQPFQNVLREANHQKFALPTTSSQIMSICPGSLKFTRDKTIC